jgi:hypothetical protein
MYIMKPKLVRHDLPVTRSTSIASSVYLDPFPESLRARNCVLDVCSACVDTVPVYASSVQH